MTETRTVKFRCHCGRDITFDPGQWPVCVACQQVCDECTCPPVLAQAPTDAAIPAGALLEPGARVERPDLEKLLAEFESSQHQYRTPDGYRLARVLAYALQVEQDAAGLRERLAILEFSNRILPDSAAICEQDRCVNCDAMRYEGHANGCRLAASLAILGARE